MGFHKNYHKGDIYKHTALRENDISVLLNQLPGVCLPGFSASSPGLVRVMCYNSMTEDITARSAVMFSQDNSLCDEDVIPIEKYSDDSKPFAVLEATLDKDQIGNAIVAGATTVSVSGEVLDYVVPDVSSPGSFKYSRTGIARVLFADSEQAIILLGGGGKIGNDYSGYFVLEEDPDNENTIKIVDGTDTLGEGTCGVYISGIDEINVNAASFTISGNTYIYLEAVYSDGNWTVQIKSSATKPTLSADSFIHLIGIVKWDSETKTVSPIQIHNDGAIYNNRYA